ncbi:C2 family cysteine protease, partial [Zavarzinella formosa]|uniref:C2 family cysteine protease n=1 Tax=Zavarzinella formosa TaxID=360055 RepID=UPI00187DAD5E
MSHFSWREQPGLVLSSARRNRRRSPLSLEGLESRITPSDTAADFPCIITPYPVTTVKENQVFSIYVQPQHAPFRRDVDVSKDYTGTMIVTTVPVTAANLATVHVYAQHAFSGGGTFAFALRLPGNGNTAVYVTDTTTFNSDDRGIYVTPAMKLEADAVSNSQVDLSWTAVRGATSYQIYENGGQIATVGSSSLLGLTPNAGPPATSYNVTGLTKDTAYDFEVKATAADGTHTSNDDTVTTLPDAPVLTVAPGTDGAYGHPDISWTDLKAAFPGTHYELAFSNLSLPQIPPAIIYRGIQNTTHVGTQLPQGFYSVKVTAILGAAATAPRVTSKPVEFQTGIQASFQAGVLTITGTTAADQIFVGQSNGEISIQGQTPGFGAAPAVVEILDHLPVDGDVYLSELSADLVTRINVSGGTGDDKILFNQGNEPINSLVAIDGGAGNDFVAPSRGPAANTTIASGEFGAANWAPHEVFDGPGPGLRTNTPIEDIFQGGAGNCYVLAPLGEVAYRGADLKDGITYLGNDGILADAFSYTVALFNKARQKVNVRVDFNGTVPTTDPQPYYQYPTAASPIPGPLQFWTILYSRAYAKLLGSQIGQSNFGNMTATLTALTGVAADMRFLVSNPSGVPNAFNELLFKFMEDELNIGGNVTAGTPESQPPPSNKPQPPEDVKLILGHGYSVISLTRDPTTHQPATVVLRNPWGVDVGAFPGKVPSGDPTDGLVTVTWQEFQTYVLFISFSGPDAGPKITTPKVATLSAGGPDSFTIGTTGYPAPTFTLGAKDKLPDGVTFNTATGALEGNPAPSAVGTYTLHITASNDFGSTNAQTLTLTVTPFSLTLSPPAPTEGDRPVNVLVGTFTDANPAAVASQYTATVKWGDGQTSNTAGKTVTIVADPNHAGVFDIMATKPGLYSKAGQNLPFSVTVSAPHVPSDTETANINVIDPPLTLTPVVPAFTVDKAVTKVLVGTFTDAFAGSHATDYTANVFWGDGQSSSSAARNITVAADPKQKGVFDIFATKPNPYSAQSGGMILTVTVMDKGGAADSVTSPVTVTTPAPAAKPLVLTATTNFAAITNAQGGANGFSITVTYDQPMNPAV